MHRVHVQGDLLERFRANSGADARVFSGLDAGRTAHLVVDMQNGFLAPGAIGEVSSAREIVPWVNAIGRAMRAVGGLNLFLRFATPVRSLTDWSRYFERFPAGERAAAQRAFEPGSVGWELWPELEVEPGDIVLDKLRYGAFAPGSSDVDRILKERGIDTVVITGTLTNCCCETTAREAMQMNYRVIFVTDATAACGDTDHNAPLATLSALFAELVETDRLIAALAA